MLDSVVIFLNKDSGDQIGGSEDIQDEFLIKIGGTDQGSRCESMFEGIKRLMSICIPDKRNVRLEESKEPMRGGGIVKYEPVEEISFSLETL